MNAEYTAKRYHQPDDEFDPSWDFSGMVEDARLLHNVGYGLANSSDWPNWSTDGEFRGARDKSESDRTGAPVPPVKRGERG